MLRITTTQTLKTTAKPAVDAACMPRATLRKRKERASAQGKRMPRSLIARMGPAPPEGPAPSKAKIDTPAYHTDKRPTGFITARG